MSETSISTDATLKTRRLLLRYPRSSDAREIYSGIKSPRFPDRLPLKEMGGVSEIAKWLEMLQENWGKGRVFSWIVEDRGSKILIGQITLSKIEGDQLWAMAYWMHPEYWGKGCATEGAERILAFGFKELGANKIWASAGRWNAGSIRVLEKIGMRYIGDNPKGYYSKGEPIATREYEISKERWQQRTGTTPS